MLQQFLRLWQQANLTCDSTHTYSALILTAPGKATGVRYYDSTGKVHVQPAKVVFNGLWGFNLIRLMLLSGMGTPYDPVNHTGSLGRGLANGYTPSTSSASVKLNVGANAYVSGNACWRRIQHNGP